MPRDELVRRGDFLVERGGLEDAEAAFEERSPRSRSLDRAFRAPITTDADRWMRNQRGLDYPGVDTPSSEPRQAVGDLPNAHRSDIIVSPDPERDPGTLADDLAMDDQLDHLVEGLSLDPL